jgi:transcriptional regulator of acetoin/glycerol metabolism
VTLNVSEFPWYGESIFLTSMKLRGAGPSILVNCSADEVSQLASELVKRCEGPVHLLSLPSRLDLPSTFEGTLLLSRIEEMFLEQQITLFEWMTTAHCRMQVVSIATTRIDRLVRERRFLESLFYRLNIVQLEARNTKSADRLSVEPQRMEFHELDMGAIYS